MWSFLEYLGAPSSQWIWGAGQTLAIVIGFYFVVRQISLARHQNSISHMIYFRDLWQSPALLRARRDLGLISSQTTGVFLPHEDVLATFANDIGIAVRAGQVDAEHVRRYFGYYVKAYWVVLEPQITKYRELNNFPDVYASFEYLFRLMSELDVRKGFGPMSAAEADRFRKEEMVQAQYHLEANSGKFDL